MEIKHFKTHCAKCKGDILQHLDESIDTYRKLVNHTSWVAVVTPTGRPKAVRYRCVLEVLDGAFVMSRCFLDFSLVVEVFVIGLSQISEASFVS